MTATLNPENKTPKAAEASASPAVPSLTLIETAANIVATGLLRHSEPDKRESFQRELIDAMNETRVDERIVILAGLKEVGLGYKRKGDSRSLTMRMPRLANPDPEEFSSMVTGALSDSEDAVQLLIEKGSEAVRESKGKQEMYVWLENMEVAVRSGN